MKKICFVIVILITGVFIANAAPYGNGSWKNVIPGNLNLSILKKNIREVDKAIRNYKDNKPVKILDESMLSQVNSKKNCLEMEFVFVGDPDALLYEYSSAIKDYDKTRKYTNEKIVRDIFNKISDSEENDFKLIPLNIILANLAAGRDVKLNILFSDFACKLFRNDMNCKGIQVILYPNGKISPINIQNFKIPANNIISYEEVLKTQVNAAQFPGGEKEMMSWLSKNIVYPENAANNAIQGRVIVKFRINKDGRVDKVMVIQQIDPDLDKEAIRAVYSMPNWIPARTFKMNQDFYFNLPISFFLNK